MLFPEPDAGGRDRRMVRKQRGSVIAQPMGSAVDTAEPMTGTVPLCRAERLTTADGPVGPSAAPADPRKMVPLQIPLFLEWADGVFGDRP